MAIGELLTLQEAARRLRVSTTTVRRKVRSGELPALRLGASERHPLRVDADALEQLLRPANYNHEGDGA